MLLRAAPEMAAALSPPPSYSNRRSPRRGVVGDGVTGGNVSVFVGFFYLWREKQGEKNFPGDSVKGKGLMLVLDFHLPPWTSLFGLPLGWASLSPLSTSCCHGSKCSC